MSLQNPAAALHSLKKRDIACFQTIASISLCLVLVAPLALVGSVFGAQKNEKRAGAPRKSLKKSKRKRQRNNQLLLLPSSPVSSSTSSPVEELKPISSGAPITKRAVSTQSVTTAQQDLTSQPLKIQPSESARVVLQNLTKKRSKGPAASVLRGQNLQEMPVPGTIQEPTSPQAPLLITQGPENIGGPLIPSPNPSQSFQGEFDEAAGGGPSGSFTIPPDTMGAVGLDKVVSYLNNNYVVQDKATGARLLVVSLSGLWSAVSAAGIFDPRVQYDPYNNRWLITAISNAQTANSSVLLGVSETPDPQGSFLLYRFIVGCAPGAVGCNAQGEWADFPMLGFNKNWIAVSWNQFTINTSAAIAGKTAVLDYPTLRSGMAVGSSFTISIANAGFCLHPATTLSPTEDTLYLVGHLSSPAATYKLNKITGTPATPTLTIGPTQTRPGGGWTQPLGDILPQQCIPGVGAATQTCPPTIRDLEVDDAFIRANVVFRNGKIYYPQTIGLPAGGITRTAAQWTALNTDGTFVDGGRVDDPTATDSNGGKWYAYPSIAVNKNNDILLGFSEFESDDYVDAGYTFRLGTDAAGTMRDPVIFKEGEDYYSKTFSGTRNRWGDYSHTVVDPVNDRDLWTIQEYAALRVGTTGQAANDSRWSTWWAKITAPAGPGDLVISEFRLRGPNGANDEYVEIFNKNTSPLTVTTVDGSSGFSLTASDGVVRFTIPNGTVIPAKGHYLAVNSLGYSLAAHPAGNGSTATGDATYTTDIPDNAGIALFSTSNPANFTLENRIDAVGSTSEANTLYKEGTGYPAITPFSIECAFYRSYCPGNAAVFGSALGCGPGSGGQPRDSDNNASDFVFVDTNHTSAGAGQRLGAPGPENLSALIERNSISVVALDNTVGTSLPPNRVRDFTSDPANNSTFGTLEIRRRIQNNTGAAITRLRFRAIDITTFPAPVTFADLRGRTSTAIVVSAIADTGTCSPSPVPCTATVQGTTLEQPPLQTLGGAFNSTYSAGTITLATPLAAGASVNVRFLLGIQQTGNFRFFVNVEALP